MKFLFALLTLAVSFAIPSVAKNNGFCPPPLPTERHRYNSDSDKVTLQVVLSNTGHVCSAKAVRGIDRKTDADAEREVRQWHFDPPKKDGKPVPVVITVDVQYKRDKEGNLVLQSRPAPTTDPSDKPSHQ